MIISYIKARGSSSSGIPCYKSITHGPKYLYDALTFRYPTFASSAYQTAKLKAVLDGALREGRLTKDPARAKQWAGAVLTKQLIQSFIDVARREGTLIWDVTLSKAASVLLLSALQVRSGDIFKTYWSEGESPCLCWKDITIRLGEQDLDDAFSRIIIRNEKHHK